LGTRAQQPFVRPGSQPASTSARTPSTTTCGRCTGSSAPPAGDNWRAASSTGAGPATPHSPGPVERARPAMTPELDRGLRVRDRATRSALPATSWLAVPGCRRPYLAGCQG
jgi:hypothetical protein